MTQTPIYLDPPANTTVRTRYIAVKVSPEEYHGYYEHHPDYALIQREKTGRKEIGFTLLIRVADSIEAERAYEAKNAGAYKCLKCRDRGVYEKEAGAKTSYFCSCQFGQLCLNKMVKD